MIRELLFSKTDHTLMGTMLDRAALAQRVTAANVANVGTPGYVRRAVVFEEELAKAMKSGGGEGLLTTHPNHIRGSSAGSGAAPEVVMVENGYFNGINNVNIDEEMAQLAVNQLDFDTAAQFLQTEFTNLRTAIRGRR